MILLQHNKGYSMKLTKAISIRIKELLKTKNLTQYKLSQLSGVPQSTISVILKGELQTIKLSTIYAICIGFEIELSEFFDYDKLKIENIED